MNEMVRKKLVDYAAKEERSIAWIARKTDVNTKSLQRFAAGTRGLCDENFNKVKNFLEEEENE